MESREDRRNDPAFEAVDEAGGGEAEGFEQAEELMQEEAENAEHTSALDGFPEERESEPDEEQYGEADHARKADDAAEA